MKKIKMLCMLLLISAAGISQSKKILPPPPPPEPNVAPPLPKTLKVSSGHPWTRNGKNVWVAKPSKPVPPPPPPKPIKDLS